jgi:type II secretory pathway component PulK
MKRGTATIAALVMLSLVGVATAVLTARVADCAERTRRATDDAQLRTLLLSATTIARQKAASSERAPQTIQLPVAGEEQATCTVETTEVNAGAIRMRVVARIGDVQAEAAYSIDRTGDKPRMAKAELLNAAY